MDEILNMSITKYHPLHDIDFTKLDKNSILWREKGNNRIKLLSFNIFLRPPPVKNNENDWKDERLYDFFLEMKDFDIICLQEMFGTLTTRRQTLIKIASKLGFFYYYEIPPPSFFAKNLIDGGLLILSRFPIIDTEFKPYSYSVLDCILGQKGCLYAKIKIKDSFLVIINTHLQASYFGTSQEEWDITVNTRLDQIKEINEFIIDLYNEGKVSNKDRVILLGDFNVDASNFKMKNEKGDIPYKIIDEYKEMMANLNDNLVVNDLWLKKFEQHKPTFGVNTNVYDQVLTNKNDINSFQTIDYILEVYFDNIDELKQAENKILSIDYDSFHIQEFLVENRIYQSLSDHFGISIDIIYK